MNKDFYILDDGYDDIVSPEISEELRKFKYREYTGGEIEKIRICTAQSKYRRSRLGEVVKQTLTIRRDGRIALTTFEAVGAKYRPLDSRNYDFPAEVTGKVIVLIREFFEAGQGAEYLRDEGEWNMRITDTSCGQYNESGTFGNEEEIATLSRKIRTILDMDLFLFDGKTDRG